MRSNSTYIITIDGTSGSGKTTISKSLAKKLGFSLLDSGKLYRSAGFVYLQSKESFSDSHNIKGVISKITMASNMVSNEFEIFFNNKKIDHLLYSEEVSESASIVSKIPEVRECMMKIQKLCVKGKGLIANGRDMGTVVFKDAKLKIYLTATVEVRARRRYLELQKRGQEVNMPDLIADIEQRDFKDSSRELSPLLPADDAYVIDSSEMSLEEVLMISKNLIEEEYL